MKTLLKRGRRAFTLIELVVVMAIIVLVLAVLLPAINNLTGSRSLQNAQNQIGAYLAAARNDAIHYQQTIGVCFYIDPLTKLTSVVEVQEIPPASSLNFPHNYVPPGTGVVTPGTGAITQWITDPAGVDIAGTRVFTSPNTGYVIPYRDTLTLAKNIGVALYTFPTATSPATTPPPTTPSPTTSTRLQGGTSPNPVSTISVPVDRLMRMGLIMFDQNGSLTSLQYEVPGWGDVAHNSQTTNTVPIPNSLAPKILSPAVGAGADATSYLVGNDGGGWCPRSSTGFYIYDRTQYQGNSAGNVPFNEADILFNQVSTAGLTTTNKFVEESWIYANGISLTVSPFDGSLMKGK